VSREDPGREFFAVDDVEGLSRWRPRNDVSIFLAGENFHQLQSESLYDQLVLTLRVKGTARLRPVLVNLCGISNSFPSFSSWILSFSIQHTLQWARDWFEGAFKQASEEVNSYLSMPAAQYLESLQPNNKMETLLILQGTFV
jgi:hypothetical protein